MIVVGLTGGMQQGKSTVGRMLRALAVVDEKADLEASYPIIEVANDWLAAWPDPLELGDQGDYSSLANKLVETLPEIIKHQTGKFVAYGQLRIGRDAASQRLHQRLLEYLETSVKMSPEERLIQLPMPITPENKSSHRVLLQWIGGGMVALVSPTIWSDLVGSRIKVLAERGYKLVTVGGIRYDHDADMIHANGGKVVRITRPAVELSKDVTETSMADIIPDIEVLNNGTIEQLQAASEQLFYDLEKASAKPKYSSTA